MAEHLIAVTAVGADRKGLLADLVNAFVPLAVHHGDPSFTMLPGGNVAIVLALRTHSDPRAVERAVGPLRADGLTITVQDLIDRTDEHSDDGTRFILRLQTQGRPGVLAEFTKIVTGYGGALLDFGTRIGGDRISVLRVELADHSEKNVSDLTHTLYSAAEQMGIGIKFYDTNLGENPLI